jgi:hypothetical protein
MVPGPFHYGLQVSHLKVRNSYAHVANYHALSCQLIEVFSKIMSVISITSIHESLLKLSTATLIFGTDCE